MLFDTTDGPMRISATEVISAHDLEADAKKARSGYVCTTPCVADLRSGRYRLYLSPPSAEDFANGVARPAGEVMTGDTDDLRLSPGRWVYRRSPGHFTTPQTWDYVLPSTALTLNIVALTVGPAVWIAADDTGGEVAGAAVTTAALAGVIASSIWVYRASRGEIQDGATTFFALP